MPWFACFDTITNVLVDASQEHKNNTFQVIVEMNNAFIKIVRIVDLTAQ